MLQFELSTLAERLKGAVVGDGSTAITGLAGLDSPEPGDLVFAEAQRYLQVALRSRASAVLVTAELAEAVASAPKPLLVVEQPRVAFVQALQLFAPAEAFPPGVHPSAQVGEGAQLGRGVHVGHNAVIGAAVRIGDGVVILDGVSIGSGCEIGSGTRIYPNSVLYPGVRVGRGCLLHAGCVIGADGFGYVQVGQRAMKVPHLGTVEIGDDVEVGANTCIDRSKTGITRVGAGTKIDNLVHIAHNVSVGMGCLIVAQVGVAGSVSVGNGVVLGGQAGIKDHVALGDGARVGAQGGVIGDVAAGVTVSGYPARPHAEKMRELAAAARLPDALKRLRALEDRLAALEAGSERGPAEAQAHASGDPGVPIIPEERDRGAFDGEEDAPHDVGPVG